MIGYHQPIRYAFPGWGRAGEHEPLHLGLGYNPFRSINGHSLPGLVHRSGRCRRNLTRTCSSEQNTFAGWTLVIQSNLDLPGVMAAIFHNSCQIAVFRMSSCLVDTEDEKECSMRNPCKPEHLERSFQRRHVQPGPSGHVQDSHGAVSPHWTHEPPSNCRSSFSRTIVSPSSGLWSATL